MNDNQYNGHERRKFVRIKKQFTINVGIRLSDQPTYWDIVSVKDISGGGVAFIYDKDIPAGAFLDFKIGSSLFKEAIRCTGVSIRSHNSGKSLFWEVVARFTDIEPTQCEAIDKAAIEFNKEKEA